MAYYKISITSSPEKRDIVIAILNRSNYNGFEEEDYGFKTYIKETEFDDNLIKKLAKQFDFSYKAKLIPEQNWNAIWEASFQPLQIDGFCAIRADFHPPFTTVTHEIIINPKMAFGTGHHETTYTMLEIMENLDFKGKKVFDYGCGTGILAILAAKMGASEIIAIDNDPNAYENTKENCDNNNTPQVKTYLGELSDVEADEFDIILANINRNVILNSLPALFLKTKQLGQVLISGFLASDLDLMTATVEKIGFSIKKVAQNGEWICMQLGTG